MKLPPSLTTVTTFSKLLALFLFITLPFAGFYLGMRYQQSLTTPMQNATSFTMAKPTPTADPTANWKIYTDSKSLFSIKYPPSLYVKGGGQQIFLAKQNATTAEKMDYSDQLVEIRIDNAVSRFENYYNTPDNSPVKGYGDLKLRSYAIDSYKAVEYGYDETKKEKEIKQNEEALKSGASVGMIYFNKGLIINKDGTVIEISTNSYYGDFKNTFDQMISTFTFAPLSTSKFLNTTTTPTQQKCAKYTRNEIAKTICATCGNGVCEPYETCTATNTKDGIPPLAECGPLYCPQDCK